MRNSIEVIALSLCLAPLSSAHAAPGDAKPSPKTCVISINRDWTADGPIGRSVVAIPEFGKVSSKEYYGFKFQVENGTAMPEELILRISKGGARAETSGALPGASLWGVYVDLKVDDMTADMSCRANDSWRNEPWAQP